MKEPFPDLDNRAPALVHSVGSAIDASLAEMLRRAQAGRAEVAVTQLVSAHIGTGRRAVWSRVWTLSGAATEAIAIKLVVAEDASDTVILQIDGEIIAELVPSWIGDRATAGDAEAREAFHRTLVEVTRRALDWRRQQASIIGSRRAAPRLEPRQR